MNIQTIYQLLKKIENTINNDLTAIKTLVDKTNNKLLAVYDIGINGFKTSHYRKPIWASG